MNGVLDVDQQIATMYFDDYIAILISDMWNFPATYTGKALKTCRIFLALMFLLLMTLKGRQEVKLQRKGGKPVLFRSEHDNKSYSYIFILFCLPI